MHAQVNSDSLISLYTWKIQKYLDRENKAFDVFAFTAEGIEVYVPATDTTARKLEFKIGWTDIGTFKNMPGKHSHNRAALDSVLVPGGNEPFGNNRDSRKLLSAYKVALDPGHIAGDIVTAKKEKKWVEMKFPPVQLIEGELTLATALILKRKLEKQGTQVMMTRNKPNQSAFGVDYKTWKDSLFVQSLDSAYARGDISFEEKNYLYAKATDTEVFRRFFSLEDVRERAKRINAFSPDLTLIIHYNVDETNTDWNKPSGKNYNMAFVGGSFTADELDRPETRVEFLRLLLTDDLEHSIEFSRCVTQGLVEKTHVRAAMDSSAVYLRDNCMKTDAPGVFCRNLILTRKVKGVICYGESLYQDNIHECRALSKKEIKVDSFETSRRVEEVAEAYYQGILNYLNNKNK